jgi:cytochrome P450
VNQLDPPDHTRLRHAIRAPFARAAVAALEAEMRAFVREQLARAAERGEIDTVRELADPLAARIACKLLDLPHEDAPRLVAWVHRYVNNESGDLGRSADAIASAMEMNAYLAEAVANWRVRPRRADSVIQAFIDFELGGRKLADVEIASHLQILVIGGTDTTPKAIGSAVVRLHVAPDQRAR